MARWSTQLEPVSLPEDLIRRPDDPRLGEIIEFWRGDDAAISAGRAVLIGFPQDEGVRRNGGRIGAADAPNEIRRWLYRLTPSDCQRNIHLSDRPPLDLGNVRISGELEGTQAVLGEVVAAVLSRGAIPIVLGGGHETAYGHFLGYAAEQRKVGIINIDAHLDLRPTVDGKGHSGSPFRQALEHPTHPLRGEHYVCLGAQPHAVSRQHWLFARERGCTIRWCDEVRHSLQQTFLDEYNRLSSGGCQVYVTMDADAAQASEVPGVSAPNSIGLTSAGVAGCAFLAGSLAQISSLDLVEINPQIDRDSRSSRWGALAIWNFLIGLATRLRLRS